MGLNTWNVNYKEWSSKQTDREKLQFLLQYAILAPSGHNAQPWLFKHYGNTLELHADRTRSLPVVDPEDRELIISCGCALYFLRAAARRFGYCVRVEEFPDTSSPYLLARINIVRAEPPSKNELSKFDAILKRHTNRKIFEERIPPIEVLDQIVAAAECDRSWLEIYSDYSDRQIIADLIAKGVRIQASNRDFRRELSLWVRSNRSQYSDGIPGYALGISDVLSNFIPFILRTFDWGKGQAVKDRKLALDSPVLAVLGSQTDTKESWLSTGQALASVLLEATKEGVSVSFLNQPIEVEDLRKNLHQLFSLDGYAQIILRVGYGEEVRPTPRRRYEEVLIGADG